MHTSLDEDESDQARSPSLPLPPPLAEALALLASDISDLRISHTLLLEDLLYFGSIIITRFSSLISLRPVAEAAKKN
jgi:hypothetical protein